MTPPLPPGPYSLIYADPPWQYRDKNSNGKRGACHKYATMSTDAICALPMRDIAAPDCVLVMWWVAQMPEDAMRVVEAWGLSLKTMTGFVWCKTTKHHLPAFGLGHWTRAGAECCLIAVRGKPKRASASVRSVVTARLRWHSQKPDEVRDRLVQLCGDVPRIELFARERVPGWDAWGLEVGE